MSLVASWSAHTLKDNNMVIVCIILWTLTESFMLPCNKYQWIIYFTPMKSVHFLNWDPAWENRAYVHKILTSLWTLKLHNFVLKHSLSIKLLLLWHTMGNFMRFIELVYVSYTKSEIHRIMSGCKCYAHKPCFLMPGHKCVLVTTTGHHVHTKLISYVGTSVLKDTYVSHYG